MVRSMIGTPEAVNCLGGDGLGRDRWGVLLVRSIRGIPDPVNCVDGDWLVSRREFN